MAKRRAYLMEDLNLIGVDYLWQVTTVVSTGTTTILICTRSLEVNSKCINGSFAFSSG